MTSFRISAFRVFNVATITSGDRGERPLPLLLLHPIGQDAGCWQFIHLAGAKAHVFAGHGGRARQPMSLADMADDAVAGVESPFDLMGVAMGSIVGQHVLLRHGPRVRSALLACAGGRTNREALLGRAVDAERLGMAAVTPSTLERWFTTAALAQPDHPGVAYARGSLLRMDPAALADAWRAMAEHDVLDRLGKVEVPVTLVAGSDDTASPVARVQATRERLPLSRLEVLRGPHMIHLEAPDRLRAALSRHLDWVTSRASSPG